MSEYEYTTAEVRADFQNSAYGIDLVGRGLDFDRWLASVKADAWDEGQDAYGSMNNPYRQER